MKHFSLSNIIAPLLWAALGCIGASAQVTPMPGDPLTGSGVVSRTVNTFATLMSSSQPAAIVNDTSGFGIPATAAAPTQTFEGTLTLSAVTTTGNYTRVSGTTLTGAATHLPPNNGSTTSLTLQFVQNGSWLIPVVQGLQYTGSPTAITAWNWNIIVGYGRVWNETTDNGYTRVSFPFTLAQYNQNCVHNGEMTFLFNPNANPAISNVAYQIAFEVCETARFNMYGNLTAIYAPSTISGDTAMENNAAAEIANRIPTKPFSALATDYPSSGVNVAEFTGQFSFPQYIAGYGLYINGVNYVTSCGGAGTSGGRSATNTYPFCSEMRWPSYSIAKSSFVETAMSQLGQQFGSGVYNNLVSNYIPQYTIGGTWTSTTFANMADMGSGNYNSSTFETDENSGSMTTFLNSVPYYNYGSPTSDSKIYDAFNLFHTNYTTPGTLWIYHSNDAFLLSAALQTYAQGQLGSNTDIWTNVYNNVFKPLNVSQGMQQVTRSACNNQSTASNCNSSTGLAGLSATGSPIGDIGEYFIMDDLAKIGYFFDNNDGIVNGTQVLDPTRENYDMMRTSNLGLITPDAGFYTGAPLVANTYHYEGLYWSKYWTTTEFPPNSGATENGGFATNPFNSTFTCQFWIPFMSGYGGNTVLLLPNNAIFYIFSDDAEFYWNYAVEQINLIKPMCGTGINYPANGATLTSNSQTFQWYMYNTATMSPTAPTAAVPATGYWLDIGKEPGGNEYYQSGNLGTVLSATVNSLPTDGSTIFVTWWYLVNGTWQNVQYSYTAWNGLPNGDSAATMSSPVAPGPLTGSSVTFSWNAGTNATAYWLDVGSTAGGNQYYQSGSLSSSTLQVTVNSLPTNGGNVYATLYTQFSSGGPWIKNSYTYTAFSTSGGAIAQLTSPTPNGSTLPGSTVTFTWAAGTDTASAYWIDVGSTAGGSQYYQSGSLPTSTTSETVTTLPTDGSEVFVTLYTQVAGNWYSNPYTFYALNASSGIAVMQTPVPDTFINGNSATFTWSLDANATSYWVDISAIAPGGNDVFQSGSLGNVNSVTVNSLPGNGTTTLYVTLYSYVGGQWLSNAYMYTN